MRVIGFRVGISIDVILGLAFGVFALYALQEAATWPRYPDLWMIVMMLSIAFSASSFWCANHLKEEEPLAWMGSRILACFITLIGAAAWFSEKQNTNFAQNRFGFGLPIDEAVCATGLFCLVALQVSSRQNDIKQGSSNGA